MFLPFCSLLLKTRPSALNMFTQFLNDMVNMLQGYGCGDANYCQFIAAHIYRRLDLKDSPVLHRFIKVIRSRWSDLTDNREKKKVWRSIFLDHPQLAASLLLTDGIGIEWWDKAEP